MKIVFADTSYYVALLLKTDSRHGRAVACTSAFSGQVVTTEWVLAELGNYLSPPHLRKLFIGLLADLKIDPDIVIVPSDSNAFDASVKLYADRLDKSWSFVDCTSFLTMNERGITDAWTTDHHFEQAGFQAILA